MTALSLQRKLLLRSFGPGALKAAAVERPCKGISMSGVGAVDALAPAPLRALQVPIIQINSKLQILLTHLFRNLSTANRVIKT